MSKKYSIFHIEGGLGKHVAATAVAKAIKKTHPTRELLVICAYPEVFLNLSFVDRVYAIGNTPYFYQDYIEGKDSLMFKHEPYFTTDHIHKKLPLIENWSKLYNLKYKKETPELIFNSVQKDVGIQAWKRDKPVAVLQTNGGPLNDQQLPYSWTRDMPYSVALNIADQLNKAGFHVIQVCRTGSQHLPNVEVVDKSMTNMELFSMLLVSQKRILIDSCLQHAAAALGLQSTVLWIGTSPKVFGYESHLNIVADTPDGICLPDSYLFDYQFTGTPYECPYLDTIKFDQQKIFESINQQK